MTGSEDSVRLLVSRTAKVLDRAYDDALCPIGGSGATWSVLQALATGAHRTQAELAAAVGVRQPTVTHHLNTLERAGLVTRERDPANRRVQRVALTAAGEERFRRLRRAGAAFDGRLLAGLEDDDVLTLRRLLAQLVDNAEPD